MLTVPIHSIVAACDINGGIGYKESLPWSLPYDGAVEDLAWFRGLTMGQTVIFGRKTYDNLPNVLKGRKVLVLSRGTHEHAVTIPNLQYVRYPCFIGGGQSVFNQALDLNLVDKIYLSVINNSYQCDTFFPITKLLHKFNSIELTPKTQFVTKYLFWRKYEVS